MLRSQVQAPRSSSDNPSDLELHYEIPPYYTSWARIFVRQAEAAEGNQEAEELRERALVMLKKGGLWIFVFLSI